MENIIAAMATWVPNTAYNAVGINAVMLMINKRNVMIIAYLWLVNFTQTGSLLIESVNAIPKITPVTIATTNNPIATKPALIRSFSFALTELVGKSKTVKYSVYRSVDSNKGKNGMWV